MTSHTGHDHGEADCLVYNNICCKYVVLKEIVVYETFVKADIYYFIILHSIIFLIPLSVRRFIKYYNRARKAQNQRHWIINWILMQV